MSEKYRAIPAGEVLAKLPRARQVRIKARASELIAEELALRDLRRSKKITQQEVADRLGGRQVYVSRLERRTDMKLSTLRDYVRAIGGDLQLIVSFPEGTAVRLADFGEGRGGEPKAKKSAVSRRRVRAQ